MKLSIICLNQEKKREKSFCKNKEKDKIKIYKPNKMSQKGLLPNSPIYSNLKKTKIEFIQLYIF